MKATCVILVPLLVWGGLAFPQRDAGSLLNSVFGGGRPSSLGEVKPDEISKSIQDILKNKGGLGSDDLEKIGDDIFSLVETVKKQKQKEQAEEQGNRLRPDSKLSNENDADKENKLKEVLDAWGVDDILDAAREVASGIKEKACVDDGNKPKCTEDQDPTKDGCVSPLCLLPDEDFSKCAALSKGDHRTLLGPAIMSLLGIGRSKPEEVAEDAIQELGLDSDLGDAVEKVFTGGQISEDEKNKAIDALFEEVQTDCQERVPEEAESCSVNQIDILKRIKSKFSIVRKHCKNFAEECSTDETEQMKELLSKVRDQIRSGELSLKDLAADFPRCCPREPKDEEAIEVATDEVIEDEDRTVPCCRPSFCELDRDSFGKFVQQQVEVGKNITNGDRPTFAVNVKRKITAIIHRFGEGKDDQDKREVGLRLAEELGFNKEEAEDLVEELESSSELKSDRSILGDAFQKLQEECSIEAPTGDKVALCTNQDLQTDKALNQFKAKFGQACGKDSKAKTCTNNEARNLEDKLVILKDLLANNLRDDEALEGGIMFQDEELCFDEEVCEQVKENIRREKVKFCRPPRCGIQDFEQFAKLMRSQFQGNDAAKKFPFLVLNALQNRCFKGTIENSEIEDVAKEADLTRYEETTLKDVCQSDKADGEFTDDEKDVLKRVLERAQKECKGLDELSNECQDTDLKRLDLRSKLMEICEKNTNECGAKEEVEETKKVEKANAQIASEISSGFVDLPGDNEQEKPLLDQDLSCRPKICDKMKAKIQDELVFNRNTSCVPMACRIPTDQAHRLASRVRQKAKEMKQSKGQAGSAIGGGCGSGATTILVREAIQNEIEELRKANEERKKNRGVFTFYQLKGNDECSNSKEKDPGFDTLSGKAKVDTLCVTEGEYIKICFFDLDNTGQGFWNQMELQCSLQATKI
ncbi:hypothetical protein TCAL_06348 [Tigriopus californicus]|uniref:Uncharacterized protein n=1 Tax=Tigriopus californicus TaxID=6832 RepID=A0A553PCG8_TIGCA|nr:uncharacterized protein LOC131892594 [Tigriopus californicus]TRY75381.1 hypothetical protein TCAL_06348 [Tigriopus californicus]|eukprot:TCALIF_06348-PA protein Name:"Protein of unknown function" AED:0.00 eAED:0.00 QI:38/1/1/1/1/1/2/56/925